MLVANGKLAAPGFPDNVWSRKISGLTKGASYKAKFSLLVYMRPIPPSSNFA